MGTHKFLNQKALYFLSRREYSVAELTNKLSKYTTDIKLIDSVINDLVSKNYLSDKRYIETVINAKKSSHGINFIRAHLRSKVADFDTKIDDLAIELSDTEQMTTAVNLLLRKYRFAKVDSVDFARAMRFLYGRGFSFDIAKQAWEEYQEYFQSQE